MGLFNALGVLVGTHKQKPQRSDVESICMRDIPGTPFGSAISYPTVQLSTIYGSKIKRDVSYVMTVS